MHNPKRLWIILGITIAAAFGLLGFFGTEVYRNAPPIPERVVTEDGQELMTQDTILDGQVVWQSIGGQQVGSIWGHGAYQAPDWSADWLHRESLALLDLWAEREGAASYDALPAERRGALQARLEEELRTNTYDPASGTLTVSADRALAFARVAAHYEALFGADPALTGLRESYALQENPIPDPQRRAKMTAFFFWTSWATAAERPGTTVSYTNNWPHEPLVGNGPSGENILWSLLSIVLLLAGIGALVWFKVVHDREEELPPAPKRDPLDALTLTPSMKAIWKYALTAVALLVVQLLVGALSAHYTVEGQGFYGFPLAEYLPYAVTRTWHLQLGVFWIATSFLAAGLFLAPAIGGAEPRFQRLGVNVLFAALVLVVVGSLAGELLRVQGGLDDTLGFWFGHQGYEFVELGRAWQIALFVGLLLWLVLMVRALWPALMRRDDRFHISAAFAGSAVAIGLFYASGFFYSARSHISVMEYWRWWVVHLWVEGFFEVFATAAVAFVFSHMGLIRARTATTAVLLSSAIFLGAGIPGTFHHLYFSGTPTSIMAVGSTFSALEVVPLVLVGFEAFQNRRLAAAAPWMAKYRWPLAFFVSVAFWNFVGAGLFGFLINPPISLYYVQGLNLTPVHGHTALFGVYGMLAIGLMLLVVRRMRPSMVWREGPLRVAFWSLNGGLALMVGISVLPIGVAQAWASIEHGLWYARSAEFLQTPIFETLRWLRAIGDSIFAVGALALAWFVAGVFTGWSQQPQEDRVPPMLDPDQALADGE